MDDPALPESEHFAALRGLATINRVSNSAGAVLAALLSVAGGRAGERLRVLDVACGGGDVTLALQQRIHHARLPWSVHGCDISDRAVTYALDAAKQAGADVRFFQRDALRDGLPEGYDLTVASLFLHHLGEPEAVELLRTMAGASAVGLAVNDLHRSRLNLLLAEIWVRLARAPRVVRVDGPLSVRAAFTAGEALRLARDRAGLRDAEVRRRFPTRWVLTWRRP